MLTVWSWEADKELLMETHQAFRGLGAESRMSRAGQTAGRSVAALPCL